MSRRCAEVRGTARLTACSRLAEKHDSGGPGKGFDVVDQRGHVPEAVSLQFGRSIAGLGTFVFDCADQRGLLTADVAAGADEDFDAHVDAAAENAFAGNSLLLAPGD